MNSSLLTLVTSIFVLICTTVRCYAQSDCTAKLNQAIKNYEDGYLTSIEKDLSPCIDYGFSKEERIRALKLIAISKLYLDEYSEAGDTYLEILKIFPVFEPELNRDPTELINLGREYTALPRWYVNAPLIGINVSFYNELKANSLNNVGLQSKNFNNRVGVNLGFGIEFVLFPRLHVGLHATYTNFRFQITDISYFSLGEGAYRTSSTQSLKTVDLPVYLKYHLTKNDNWIPFVTFGASPSFLLSAELSNFNGLFEGVERSPVEQNVDLNLTSLRRSFNYSLFGSVGFNKKIGFHRPTYLRAELLFGVGMLNVARSESIWTTESNTSQKLKFPGSYVDDDFKLNYIALSFGLTIPLYKARKI